MKPWSSIVLGLFLGSAIVVPVKAQISVDGTTNTTINSTDNGIRIDAGNRAGDNLFHSFEQFSVTNGSEAFFNNANDIVNIFSRVTGGNISNIDGLIRANGSASLFLINPAGIIFGEGASLDIGGSFLGSTASSILFPDGVEFNATDSENPPLLTINAPLGLGLQNNPGEIINRSIVQNSAEEVVGLEVAPGNNLALIGGQINFERGQATAPGGNIELGGLSQAGTVRINEDGSLSFPEGVTKANINLSNGADVDARKTGGGSITVNARNLNLSAGEFGSSLIRAGIRPESTSAEAQAGDVTIDVAEKITLDDSRILNQVNTGGVGNSGNITINTGSIEAINGSIVDASTLGQGDAGSVNITATGDITFDGEDSDRFQSGATSFVTPGAVGNAGDVTISTTNLNLSAGGRVSASTIGQGNAGSVNITATGDITFDGEDSDGTPSGVTSLVNLDAVGNSGGVTISTANLNLSAGGRVDASAVGQGNPGSVNITATGDITLDGRTELREPLNSFSPSSVSSSIGPGVKENVGDITISTNNLTLINGGEIFVTTAGQENGGNLTVTASESIKLIGSNGFAPSGLFAYTFQGSGNGGNVSIATEQLILRDEAVIAVGNSQQVVEEAPEPLPPSLSFPPGTGAAGNLEINAGSVEVSNQAKIVADNANGVGGNLTLNADSLTLENEASISASTTADVGQGGILTLNIDDTLLMSDRSLISAEAFNSADGGNIDIKAGFVIAAPNQNNDIIASAAQGDGGKINITTNSIFGIEERSSIPANQTNDIDASSEFGLDGAIAINELEVNPAEALEELPTEIIDVAGLVEQNLCQQAKDSEFIVTGKGGIAPNPTQARDGDISAVDLVEPALFSGVEEAEEAEGAEGVEEAEEEIVEAQGWMINDRGKVELVAHKTDLNGSPPQPKDAKICSK